MEDRTRWQILWTALIEITVAKQSPDDQSPHKAALGNSYLVRTAAAHFRLSILSFQAFLPTTVGWPGEMVEIQLWTGNKVGMEGSGRYFDQ